MPPADSPLGAWMGQVDAQIFDLQRRITMSATQADLQNAIDTLNGAINAHVQAVNNELSRVNDKLAQLAANVPADQTQTVAELQTMVNTITAATQQLDNELPDPAPAPAPETPSPQTPPADTTAGGTGSDSVVANTAAPAVTDPSTPVA